MRANSTAGTLRNGRAVPLRRIDRFVVAAGPAAPAAFIVSNLYVAHNARERLTWPIHRAVGGRTLLRATGSEPMAGAARAAIEDLARLMPELSGETWSWIVDTDYTDSPRNRTIAFVFPKRQRLPTLVVKRVPLHDAGGSRSLQREREALEMLHRKVPAALARTLPRVIAHRVADGWESLAVNWLPGRSAYTEMQTRLAPGSAVAAHFRHAAEWLAQFHDATAEPGHVLQPARSEGFAREALAASGRSVDLGWLARLCDWCAYHPVAAVTAHGDFWARNLLLGHPDCVTGVVDWEQSARSASPFEDLFQFPVTYGLAYPWRRYRRAPAEESFRRTFLADNRVSREVREYMHTYCRYRGVETEGLEWWFRLFLLGRAQATESKGEPWIRFEEMLATAGRSVFSG